MPKKDNKIIFALPKGRIAEEVLPMLKKVGIEPEPAFFDEKSRQLRFATNQAELDIIRVRSFDVPSFVGYGAAAIGIAGLDVLKEFDHPQIYTPLDLKIAKCRLSVAESKSIAKDDDPARWTHIRIATKYPVITKRYFAERGVQAECIKLHGAMELAPSLNLCERIVDLVDSGRTLTANGLVEVETIMDVSSYLIVNRTMFKTRSDVIGKLINGFQEAVNG